ncbi:MAG: tRNA (guanosine(37)-N1)-methyltransferase TrmD [Phycisphaerales bacterium]|nr:tRNA (guanosine(37)-N1)-methyltransferase TrmD [Phycisphaerales bacterium]
MRIDILTTFPEMFATAPPGVLGVSIPARAARAGAVSFHTTNIRDFAGNKHERTDDRPFGGGPGMVMMCQPLWDAVRAVEAADATPATRILLTPQGTPLTQALVEDLATRPRLLLIAGHYEGIDQRVIDQLAPLEVSIGDYVLSGGELAALVLIDAVVRLLPGVLGHDASAAQDSFSPLPATNPNAEPIDPTLLARWCEELGVRPDARLLDCPHYTRPREWEGIPVPEELLSGDHNAVARWRLEQMVRRTRERRGDLLEPRDR